MSAQYHPLVKRLLDGELSLAELPAELRGDYASSSRNPRSSRSFSSGVPIVMRSLSSKRGSAK